MSDHNKPNREGSPDQFQSRFDNIPPQMLHNLSARDYVDVLKEARWNNDYKNKVTVDYLKAKSIDDVIFSNYRCSIPFSLVLRYCIPDFFASKGLNIDKVTTVESDGDYPASFSAIEVSPTKSENR